MPCVLHISAAGNIWWGKRATGWVALPEPDKGPVWVLTDLAEETFVEITVPRLFGNDRSNLVKRQLVNRFPDTPFRDSMAAQRGGGLMDRLAPPVEILAAIEPADRVNDALRGLSAPLVGVWGTSMLLAHAGCQKRMPANLLIVLCQPSGMRILFIKDRTPVLTRMVAVVEGATDQSMEILRTMRHLENTRVIERGRQRFPVMLLGAADGLAAILERDRLDLLDAAALRKTKLGDSWQQALLDMVCKSPAGQLAPMALRESFLAMRLGSVARVLAALCVVGAIAVTTGNVRVIARDHTERNQLEATIGELDNTLAQVDADIQGFGVAPDLLRRALAVDSEEIAGAPHMPTDLVDLSRTISPIPGARAKSVQWRLLEPGEAPCPLVVSGPAAVVPEAPDGGEPSASPGRMVELKLEVTLAPDIGPFKRQQQASSISQQLTKAHGVQLYQDPARALRDGDLSASTSQADAASELVWCASLTGRSAKTQGAQP
jgi:hypothetical protein